MPGFGEDFDMSSAVDALGGELGFGAGEGEGSDDLQLDTPGKETQAPAEAAPAAEEQPAAPETPGTPGKNPPAIGDEPPKTWRKEAAATWATLPQEARAEILKREEDIFKGIEVYKAEAGFGKSVKTAISSYLPVLEQYGLDPVNQIQSLMEAHHTLALGTPEQKFALFQQLATDYQIDLAQLAGQEAPYIDPAVQNLQKELQAVKSQLTAENNRQRATAQQAMERQIETFSKDPANPYFDEVAHDMVRLIESEVCNDLQSAYEHAVWANPVTRAKEISRQQAAETKAKADQAAAHAAQARRATQVNVRTSAKSGSAAAPLGSMDDTLKETFARMSSRS